ncbi:hypothetical protein ACLI4Q_17400 [Natrialbaceae archaeon A-CW1-1]
MTADLQIDGEGVHALDGAITEDGERYLVASIDDVRYTLYQGAPDEALYTRTEVSDEEHAEQILEGISHDDEKHVLQVTRKGEGVVFFVREENAGDQARSIENHVSLFVRSLYITQYEQVDESIEQAVYEPRNGWFEGAEGYRVTDSTGHITVDPDSYAIESADVSFNVVSTADSYAKYLLTTTFSDEPTSQEITYTVDTENVEIEILDWVEEKRNTP